MKQKPAKDPMIRAYIYLALCGVCIMLMPVMVEAGVREYAGFLAPLIVLFFGLACLRLPLIKRY